MTIITGIARGIQFLHTGVNPGLFGNNIKIENILLDDSLNAKVSGYNISFTSKGGLDSTLKEQSAPNHNGTNDAEKEDIYQLGVILLEIITGKIITSSIEVEELKNERTSANKWDMEREYASLLRITLSSLNAIAIQATKSTDEFEGQRAGDPFWVMRLVGYPGVSTVNGTNVMKNDIGWYYVVFAPWMAPLTLFVI
ncbi:probable LRR receptor-like serine/threonine-protein kinase At1g14390 [Gastrolobium bilobum]|uniref:probable LRR receptor-like serine/threonine-protein kinase At1g14390 n=1 Tax=Gastrolobium bilobum TaxID=150636 RepID=UPI002AB05C5D|nr:probable LRR receptor-like serine/threonine-protein kinase At1g14390 [Gastrolobium bilobum]